MVLANCAALWALGTASIPHADWPPSSIQYSTGDFLGQDGPCPPEGKPRVPGKLAHFDPVLNRLKNRDQAPINGAMAMKIQTILARKTPNALAAAKAGKKRDAWPPAARSEVVTYENRFVTVEGFFSGVDIQDPESCNGFSAVHVDYHLWLAPYPPSTFSAVKHIKHHSMVVEISPRTLQWHPEWTRAALQSTQNKETRVRVTGWLFFDQEHPENLYVGKLGPVKPFKTRRTLWEIHPVHRIELWNGADWQDL